MLQVLDAIGKFNARLSSFVSHKFKGDVTSGEQGFLVLGHSFDLASCNRCQVLLCLQHPKWLSSSFLGGWQEQVTYPHHAQNLLLFHQMLQRNGFRQEHIKAFFASEGQASGILRS